MGPASRQSPVPTAALTRKPYRRQANSAPAIPASSRLPQAEAVSCRAATRIPAEPSVPAKPPTVKISCSTPMPSAPIRPASTA